MVHHAWYRGQVACPDRVSSGAPRRTTRATSCTVARRYPRSCSFVRIAYCPFATSARVSHRLLAHYPDVALVQDTKEWAFQASTPDNDPLNEESWPRELREAIWAKFTAWTGLDWDQALRSKCGKL